MNFEITEKIQYAIDLIKNSNKNIFITGKAGTGKSTLLEYLRDNIDKNLVVLAPTGVSALNVKGQTIHSFFGFKPNITIDKIKKGKNSQIYKNLELIIIDEVSMVRADLLDCIDKFLKLSRKNEKPFGGIQIVFVGDLYQLPPVVTYEDKKILDYFLYKTPYFFSAYVMSQIELVIIELKKIYRQKDNDFINLLNLIRNKKIDQENLDLINKRYLNIEFNDDLYITLTSTNKLSENINIEKLSEIKGKKYNYRAEIEGNFDSKYYPTNEILDLKIGSQVMLINNDPKKRWVNGSIGKIIDITENFITKNDIIIIRLDNGNIVNVEPNKWDIYTYVFNEENNKINQKISGSFIQYPIKLSWAITIHKSQGKTFEKVVIDTGSGCFTHGQIYVALSRCTSLQGIILKKPIYKSDIIFDFRIENFLNKQI
ncbi:AAA family ATPase [bacterium]|nr:AAA family ATPase [bacterium]